MKRYILVCSALLVAIGVAVATPRFKVPGFEVTEDDNVVADGDVTVGGDVIVEGSISGLGDVTVTNATLRGTTTIGSGTGALKVVSGVVSAGTLEVAQGGTGVATITGIVKGDGTNVLAAAVAGTDYLAPNAVAVTNVILTATETNTIIVLKGLITSWTVEPVVE
jgi:hypothetical protein